MKRYTCFICAITMSLLVACNGRKNGNDVIKDEMEIVVDADSLQSDTLHQSSTDTFEDGHMPPPPPSDERGMDGPPPPPSDGHGFDGPPPPPSDKHGFDGPPPPPDGKGHPRHDPDNMRGFDPASEDDMDDNGMSRYMENNDEEGWD